MFQRLPIPLAQVKAGNTSGNLLNKIHQIICSLYRPQEVNEKVYNNIMNLIWMQCNMDTIFMISNTIYWILYILYLYQILVFVSSGKV